MGVPLGLARSAASVLEMTTSLRQEISTQIIMSGEGGRAGGREGGGGITGWNVTLVPTHRPGPGLGPDNINNNIES